METDTKKTLSPLQTRILHQRTMLYNMLLDPMQRAANRCASVWNDKDLLDAALMDTIRQIPYCTFLYAMDPQGRQISANASHDGLIEKDFQRERSNRPYMQQLSSEGKMSLSNAYISLRANRPSLTAIEPEAARQRKPGRRLASFWLTSSLTGVAAALGVIAVLNLVDTDEPEAIPTTAAVETVQPIALPAIDLDVKAATLAGPLAQELEDLQADLKKAEEVMRGDVRIDF